MRIAMILDGTFPPDPRVEREARALGAAGHEVHLLARPPDGKHHAPVDWLRLHKPERICRKGRWTRKPNNLLFFATWRNPAWRADIRDYLAKVKPGAVHVHDLPLAGPTLAVAKPMRIPVVLDLHELYPYAVAEWLQHLPQPLRWLTADTRRWLGYQKRCCRRADEIIVVSEAMRKRFLEDTGISGDRVHLVMNVIDIQQRSQPIPAPGRPSRAEALRLTYVGVPGSGRGLETLIRAMPTIRQHVPTARAVLVGPDGKHRGPLERLARDQGVRDAVDFEGWRPADTLDRYFAQADIGVIPLLRNRHRDVAVPNKLFELWWHGKPVLVSDSPAMSELVLRADAGLVHRSGDAEDLAEKAVRLLTDRVLRTRLGANGAAQVARRYNWGAESQRLLEIYSRLLSEGA